MITAYSEPTSVHLPLFMWFPKTDLYLLVIPAQELFWVLHSKPQALNTKADGASWRRQDYLPFSDDLPRWLLRCDTQTAIGKAYQDATTPTAPLAWRRTVWGPSQRKGSVSIGRPLRIWPDQSVLTNQSTGGWQSYLYFRQSAVKNTQTGQ